MVLNSPHMAWVDLGEGTFTCQVNRSTEWELNWTFRTESKGDNHPTTTPTILIKTQETKLEPKKLIMLINTHFRKFSLKIFFLYISCRHDHGRRVYEPRILTQHDDDDDREVYFYFS